jgi:hypothetical protein
VSPDFRERGEEEQSVDSKAKKDFSGNSNSVDAVLATPRHQLQLAMLQQNAPLIQLKIEEYAFRRVQ